MQVIVFAASSSAGQDIIATTRVKCLPSFPQHGASCHALLMLVCAGHCQLRHVPLLGKCLRTVALIPSQGAKSGHRM